MTTPPRKAGAKPGAKSGPRRAAKRPLITPRDPNLPLMLKLKAKVVPDKKKEESKRAGRKKIVPGESES